MKGHLCLLPLLSVDAAEGDLGLLQLPCPLSSVELLAARLAGVCESSSWLLEILDGRLGGRRPVWSSWFELCVDAILDSFSLGVGDRKSSADFVRDCIKNENTFISNDFLRTLTATKNNTIIMYH